MGKEITIQTNANIALIKYWGKRNEELFLPTKSSLSVGLAALTTTTRLTATDSNSDQIFINKEPAKPTTATNIISFLNVIRKNFNLTSRFCIYSENNFPTAAGLASSASGFAAIALGVNQACALNLNVRQLSILARRGSGSACRSVVGGFALWHAGLQPDGQDSYAEQFLPAGHWPTFRVIIAVVSAQEKVTSSRAGMQCTVATSPVYAQWLADSNRRLDVLKRALVEKNFSVTGQVAEADCLGMHQTMHTSRPPLNYWTDTTIAVMQAVKNLRIVLGLECYFTIDAGPNVKILCQENTAPEIARHITAIPGVQQVITSQVAHAPTVTQAPASLSTPTGLGKKPA